MKFLLDQRLPRSTAILLRDKGIDTLHVGEIGLSATEDITILEEGRRSGRTVVTLDADFHALMVFAGATSPSVIRIRIEGLRAEEMTTLIEDILKRCRPALESGALVSVQPSRLRIKQLPLIR